MAQLCPDTAENAPARRRRAPTAAPVARALSVAWLAMALASWPAPGAAEGPQGWWNEAWLCRKAIQVTPVAGLEADPAAVVTFTTCGQMRRDAADLRIIALDGSEVPYAIIACGFEDLCTVAFPMRAEPYGVYAYFGNAAAERPTYDWQPHRGLVLETRSKGPGSFNNWTEMQALIENSPTVLGRGLHPAIFDGHNRFGPSDEYISIYTGYLACPTSGAYGFATTSDDASFLLVDGALVVDWPSTHTAVADARHNASVDLEAGAHRIEYYHVESTGDQVAEAAWQPPGADTYAVIPAEAFVPFWQGTVVAYEQRQDPAPVDFAFWQESALPVGDGLLSAVRFALAFPAGAATLKQHWDFGDGLQAEAQNPVHIYGAPGKYAVRLTLGDGVATLTQHVRVWQNEVLGGTPDELAGTYVNLLAAYNLAAMHEDALLTIAQFAAERGAARLEEGAFLALRRIPGTYSSLAAGRQLIAYAEAYRTAGRVEEAIALLADVAKQHAKSEVVCEALHRRGQLLLALERPEEAVAVFRLLEERAKGQPDWHLTALIDLGDYHRHQADPAKAREYYRKAEALGAQGGAVVRGGFSQAALEYLRANENEAAMQQLASWERAYPTDKLDAYFSVLKAAALFRLGEVGFACAELNDVLKVDPQGNFAPHALLLRGDSLAILARGEEAQACYKALLEEYPESPVAEYARQHAMLPPQSAEGLPLPIVNF